MAYNKKLYKTDDSVIDSSVIYDDTQKKLQSEINSQVNTSVTDLNQNALLKTGGTMTGALAMTNGSPSIYLNNSAMDVTNTSYPSPSNSVGFRLRDTNDKNVMIVTDRYETDGKTGLWLSGWKTVDNSNISNSLYLYVDNDGHRVVGVSDAAAWRIALNAVNKSGDTLNGDLIIAENNPRLYLKSNSIDATKTSYSEATSSAGLIFGDLNNQGVAEFTDRYETDGATGALIGGCKRVNGANAWNYLRLLVKPNGTKEVIVADANSWRKAINLAHFANETIQIDSSIVLSGVINGSSTWMYFDFVTPKFLDNISTITVTTMSGYICGVSGAVDGSAATKNYASSPYTITCVKQGLNHVRIGINKGSTYTNVTANTPVCYFGTLTLKFT